MKKGKGQHQKCRVSMEVKSCKRKVFLIDLFLLDTGVWKAVVKEKLPRS